MRTTVARYLPVNTAAVAEQSDDEDASAPDADLVRIFLAEAGTRVAEMRRGLHRNADLEMFVRHAHTLKGAARHITDGPLPAAAAELETCARKGDTDRLVDVALPGVRDRMAPFAPRAARSVANDDGR